MSRRPVSSFIPGYNKNAVIQLIIVSGVCFVIYQLLSLVMLVVGSGKDGFNAMIVPNVSLPALVAFKAKFWTLLTYGWIHHGFWELLSNMLWLYCFGSVVQSLVGYKQVIPLYFYSLIVGGVFYLLSQFIPGNNFQAQSFYIGGYAGLVGLAVAAITVAPDYRYFLGPSLSLPIILVISIFGVLMILYTGMNMPRLFLLIGGGFTGFVYIKALQSGRRPGEWIYDLFDRVESIVTPNDHNIWLKHDKKRSQVLKKMYEPKQGISQKRIDDILDKINLHGYNSLTAEEKDILLRASKENS
ncbi:MAG TPA: rhomboid family intramembrane serine protease [Flavipsychrobacter sp.]|nr:rhomboid family intramembrane serine protease [Flavipsychrobacter sp.]